MNISVAGLGYVGLSLSCLLSRSHAVTGVDVLQKKVDLVNAGISPIKDVEISRYLSTRPSSLVATSVSESAYAEADLIVIATPTNYDDAAHSFDTGSIESVLNLIQRVNTTAPIVIKSTVPVGFTKAISSRYPNLTVLFSPEFLREGQALHDNLHPSRIIVGIVDEKDRPIANCFAKILADTSDEKDVPTRVMGSTEAEAIKLFANTYLALRVSFFNELDTYAESKGLSTREIIDGVCLDPRIGAHYNNPSFGYGGYCLPKDSKQLLSNYREVPQNLIRAIVDSNATRKQFIANAILARNPEHVGVYRLVMKAGSDNFRQSSTIDIVRLLREHGICVTIYEPVIEDDEALGCRVSHDLQAFKNECDLIVANRFSKELADVQDKVYTRDLWMKD